MEQEKCKNDSEQPKFGKPVLETILGFGMGVGGGALTAVSELTTGASIYHPNTEYIISTGMLITGAGLTLKGIVDFGKLIRSHYSNNSN